MKFSNETNAKQKQATDNIIFTNDIDDTINVVAPQPNADRFDLGNMDEVNIDDI
jgi:hypothetical protein